MTSRRSIQRLKHRLQREAISCIKRVYSATYMYTGTRLSRCVLNYWPPNKYAYLLNNQVMQLFLCKIVCCWPLSNYPTPN